MQRNLESACINFLPQRLLLKFSDVSCGMSFLDGEADLGEERLHQRHTPHNDSTKSPPSALVSCSPGVLPSAA